MYSTLQITSATASAWGDYSAFTLKSSKAVYCSVPCCPRGTRSTKQKEGVKIFQAKPRLKQPNISFSSCSQKQLFLYQATSAIQMNIFELSCLKVKNHCLHWDITRHAYKIEGYGGGETNAIWLLKQEQIARNSLAKGQEGTQVIFGYITATR